MKKLFAAALAATAISPLAMPALATAQAIPNARIATIDANRIYSECTACVAASAQLTAQRQQLQQRGAALSAPIEAEIQALQPQIQALGQNAPDAALQQRITQLQQRRAAAQQELATGQQTLERNANYVTQQINVQLEPVIEQVRVQRGANIVMSLDATVAADANLDITNDVLAALNQRLPSVSTVAPAPAPVAQTTPPQSR